MKYQTTDYIDPILKTDFSNPVILGLFLLQKGSNRKKKLY